MRSHLIKDLLNHLDVDGALKIGYANAQTTQAIEKLSIPLNLKRLLQWSWLTCGSEIGPYYFDSVNEITTNPDYETLIQYRMIPVGHAINGDIVVLRFDDKDCSIGLISHDEFWEERGDPNKSYAELAATIDEYLFRVTEKLYLPIDFYAAEEWEALKKKELSERNV